MKTQLPSHLRAIDRFLSIWDSTVFFAALTALLLSLLVITFTVSAWALIGIVALLMANGSQYYLRCLMGHVTQLAPASKEDIEKAMHRPSRIHFFILSLCTGWGLHLGQTDWPLLLVSLSCTITMISLGYHCLFIDKQVPST